MFSAINLYFSSLSRRPLVLSSTKSSNDFFSNLNLSSAFLIRSITLTCAPSSASSIGFVRNASVPRLKALIRLRESIYPAVIIITGMCFVSSLDFNNLQTSKLSISDNDKSSRIVSDDSFLAFSIPSSPLCAVIT